METKFIWIIAALAIIGYLLYRFTKKESKKIEEGHKEKSSPQPDFSTNEIKQNLSDGEGEGNFPKEN